MPESEPSPVRLADYRPPAFFIDRAELHFDLAPRVTRVRSRLSFRANPQGERTSDLSLDGEDLVLEEIAIDGRQLDPGEYEIGREKLVLTPPGDEFVLETVARISPAENTCLEGLYLSGGKLCTQCEAEGFRRITWFLDRPDVLTRFLVTIAADRDRFPVLLANGNLEASGGLSDGRHWVRWRDPFPKPSYLFALVAGDLARISDSHRTASGREIKLEIYVEPHNIERCAHAMWSLKEAMAWDEKVFGLECDLDQYMIVAVDDFNMGAMENKGLNIFNSRYVLASPETATDTDFENITAVIAHEYFHNWTGNRVTCRDWFQLALKEGLTVYREQEFFADTFSRGVKRINDARLVTSRQFVEDSGPLAHPVRPSEYFEINNFYTLTVYEKGAELVRLIATLIGREPFIAGVRRYLRENDGTAATIEDFIMAMEEESGKDLSFMLDWYGQAGTPELGIESEYRADESRLILRFSQRHRPSPGQEVKKDLVVPVRLALLDEQGSTMEFALEGGTSRIMEGVLPVSGDRKEFVLTGVRRRPVLSLLRGFSAPVRLDFTQSRRELALLLAHDSDPYCRWRAGQELVSSFITAAVRAGRDRVAEEDVAEAARAWEILIGQAREIDCDLLALLLKLPDYDSLANDIEPLDPERLFLARESMADGVARLLAGPFAELYDSLSASWPSLIGPRPNHRVKQSRLSLEPTPCGSLRPELVGRRRLSWLCLDYLLRAGRYQDEVRQRFLRADNMTDELAGLRAILHHRLEGAEEAEARFRERWHGDCLLEDKLLAVRVTVPAPETVETVAGIIAQASFQSANPNRLRAVLGSFSSGNPLAFHRADGRGYELLAGQLITIDQRNPQTASRLFAPFSLWRRYEPGRAAMMRDSILSLQRNGLSPDLSEMVEKTLRDRT